MQAKSYFYNVKHSDNQRYIRPQAMGFQLSVKLRIKTGNRATQVIQDKHERLLRHLVSLAILCAENLH